MAPDGSREPASRAETETDTDANPDANPGAPDRVEGDVGAEPSQRPATDFGALGQQEARRLAIAEQTPGTPAQRAEAARAALQALCDRLLEAVPHYHWVGFYLVRPEEPQTLRLGPYAGAATDHTRIPFGRGICGQVALSEQPMWVPDVTAQDNYLACSLETRAEVVVPVMWQGQFVGQLDIDSHVADPFGPADRDLLEGLCTAAAPVVRLLLDDPEPVA